MGRASNLNPFFLKSCQRDRELETLFESLNVKYYEGKLPRYQVFTCTTYRNFGHFTAGWCSTKERKIFLRSNLARRSILWSLTHEMVHAKFPESQGHSESFLKELRRIRKLGAPLSPKEIDFVADAESERLNLAALRRTVREAVRLERLAGTAVYKYIERDFSEPIQEIKRRYNVDKMIKSEKKKLQRVAKSRH